MSNVKHPVPEAPAFPKRVELELVSDCNLRCTYCPRRHLDELNGYMDFDLFAKIVDEIQGHPETILTLHRRGESLLHPRLKDMLALVAGRFPQIQMATNGTLLKEELIEPIRNALTFLSFSLDIPERFARTRVGANYDKVVANIERFLTANKGRVQTQASMVDTGDLSETQLQEFIDIWKGKVDRVRIYQAHSMDGRFGSLSAPRTARKPCIMPFYEMLIYENGLVARCNHDWNGDKIAPMGDANFSKLAEIWRNEAYTILRGQHASLTLTDPVCADCDSWYPEEGCQDTGITVKS